LRSIIIVLNLLHSGTFF